MSYKILTLNDSKEWSDLLAKLPEDQQDIYYTPEYYSLYENYGDGKAQCFVFEKDGHIALYPFLINSVNELGYNLDKEYFDIQGAYGYNGVVSSSYDKDFVKCFYTEFNAYCEENRIIAEFTRFNPLTKSVDFSDGYLDTFFDRTTVIVECNNPDIEDLRQQTYSKQGRKDVRKALRQQLLVNVANDINEYLEFYEIYLQRMKELNSLEYYWFNQEFFSNIFYKMKDSHKLFIVKNEDENILGGIMYLYKGGFAHNYLSAGKFSAFKMNINDLLQDLIINDCIKTSINKLNLGGGSSDSTDDNLLKFKQKFSSVEESFFIGKKVHNSDVYQEVILQWEIKNPKKMEKYKNHLLKYRY